MNNALRRQVLQSFKKLHRTRQNVFRDDDRTLIAARDEINKQFRNKMDMTDKEAIDEAVRFANEVEKELRTMVIQAVESTPGTYQMRITPDTMKMVNVPFKECGTQ